MPNILVAVTAYRGSVKAQCAMSLLKLQRQFHIDGIESEFRYADMTLIRRARNYFATFAAQENTFTHLLFVDDDMEFEPIAVSKMLKANTSVIGCACASRKLDVDRVIALARDNKLSTEQAMAFATSFNVFLTAERRSAASLRVIEGERIEVDGIGMGLALIDATCLRELIRSGVDVDDKTFRDGRHGLNGPMYGFFSAFPSEADPDAEDYAFCQRWQQRCGGTIQALISEAIGHVGEMVFRANFLEMLKLAKR